MKKEVEELHEYTRSIIQVLVSWYTFFITLNFASAGWFGTEIAKTDIKNHKAIYLICVYFVVQNILSIIGLSFSKRFFISTNDKIKTISKNKSSLPIVLFLRTIFLFQVTLFTLIVFWIGFALLL